MMNKRVNVIIPNGMLKMSKDLIEKGLFSNFSELVRQGLRNEIRRYQDNIPISKDELELMRLIEKARKDGKLHSEEELDKILLE
jgi:Arc/MetJ-type ribon-helix-helix transcriptional regulator